MPVDPSLFDRDAEILRQRHGPDVVQSGSEVLAIERIPVDSPSIMRITSGPDLDGNIVGGVPVGRVTRIYGNESSGKSLFCWNIIKNAQQYRSPRFPDGLSCCLWDTEKQYDPVFVRKQGVDTDALKIVRLDIIEDIAAAMELLLRSIHLHVIDSASFATPLEELVGKQGDKDPQYQVQVGAHARAWKRAINRIHHAMDPSRNVLLITDHVGVKNVAAGGYQVEEPLSGRRMRYRSDLSICFRSGSWLFYDKRGQLATKDKVKEETGMSPEGQKSADGVVVAVKVDKARVCRPLRTAMMRLDLRAAEFDHAFELADYAIYYDADGTLAHHSGNPTIAVKSGNFFKVPGYDKSVNGIGQLRDLIDGDPMLQRTIFASMMKGS